VCQGGSCRPSKPGHIHAPSNEQRKGAWRTRRFSTRHSKSNYPPPPPARAPHPSPPRALLPLPPPHTTERAVHMRYADSTLHCAAALPPLLPLLL
jgi:hypothetical protein